MNKIISVKDISKYIKDGMTVMVGGFLGIGSPENIIDEIIKNDIKNLTIVCNDTAFPDKGIGKLIVKKLVKKAVVSHIGTNAETGTQMLDKTLEVELVPQGTLAERVRCGGVGLGGVLTETGIGTEVENGKQIIHVSDKAYILETPIHANIAILYASVADEKGNLVYEGAARNFNPVMAMAADTVIVQANKIVKAGELNPDNIVTPHIVVDYIVKGE